METYCIVEDQDGHYYVIPSTQAADWDRFIQAEDYGYSDLPDYAVSIDGSPSRVHFINYTIE